MLFEGELKRIFAQDIRATENIGGHIRFEQAYRNIQGTSRLIECIELRVLNQVHAAKAVIWRGYSIVRLINTSTPCWD
jgi:hypothetical protein